MAEKSVQCCDGCDRGLPGCVLGRCETEKKNTGGDTGTKVA